MSLSIGNDIRAEESWNSSRPKCVRMKLMRVVRYLSWWLAVLLTGLGVAAATAAPPDGGGAPIPNTRSVFVAVALVLAVIVLLVAHQPWGRLTTSSIALLIGSIAVPLLLAHDVPDTSGCRPSVPCDPAVRLWHPGVLVALFAVFLAAALICAAVNSVRAVARTRRSPSETGP
jgi:hypothetical protein